MSEAKINVAVVDDHKMVAMGMASLLRNEGMIVTFVASNGAECMQKLEAVPTEQFPDVILLDVFMPVMDGRETLHHLKARYPDLNVVVLTGHDTEFYKIQMYRGGANAYLLKDGSPEEVVLAIRTVVEHGFYFGDDQIVLRALIANNKQDDSANQLTPREIEFIRLCCEDLSYVEIAQRMFISPRTVDGFRENVFRKIGAKSRTAIVLYAIKQKIHIV